jgi:hypothetical protein
MRLLSAPETRDRINVVRPARVAWIETTWRQFPRCVGNHSA